MVQNILGGIIANFLTLLAGLLIGYVLFLLFRRRLYTFWGIDESRKMRIYTSSLHVKLGGAVDSAGQPRSFQGLVVTQLEMLTATMIRSLFYASLPGRFLQQSWARTLLMINADAQVLPCSDPISQLDLQGTVVTLGSPGYNTVSQYLEDVAGSPLRFVQGNAQIQLPDGRLISTGTEGIILRIRYQGRAFFYCAGLSEAGTASAAFYLSTRWRYLHKRHKAGKPFWAVVSCVGGDYTTAQLTSDGTIP